MMRILPASYYDFEDLANGPVYEYGMALDVKF